MLSLDARLSISIHALLAESDQVAHQLPTFPIDFYPRSPCGERRQYAIVHGAPGQFLSTLSLRRATRAARRAEPGIKISIHALLAESDMQQAAQRQPKTPFLSTLSLRRATSFKGTYSSFHQFLSTLSLRRATADDTGKRFSPELFLSTLSLRRATQQHNGLFGVILFLSTLSLRRATRPVSVLYSLNRYFYPRSPCGERRCSLARCRTDN